MVVLFAHIIQLFAVSCKQYYLRKNFIELRPENPAFESIILAKEEMNTVVIEGKAVGLCRDI